MLKLIFFVNRYGFLGSVRLARDLFLTFLFHKKARIVRYPNYIRKDNSFAWGKGFTAGVGLRIDVLGEEAKLILGDNIQVNDYVHIAVKENVFIGNNVLIASKVFISDHNHGIFATPDTHSSPDNIPVNRPLESKPVIINDNVWLGEGSAVLPGVTIGKGCIVGTNAVVTKNIPDYCVAVGVPAKVIKHWCFETNCWISLSNTRIT